MRGPPKGRVRRVGGSCQVCIQGVAWAMLLKMTRRRFWVAVAGLVEAPGCHPALKEECPTSASSPMLVLGLRALVSKGEKG